MFSMLTIKLVLKFFPKNMGDSREIKKCSMMIKIILGWFINSQHSSALHRTLSHVIVCFCLDFHLFGVKYYSQDHFNTNMDYIKCTSSFISYESQFESKPTHFQFNRIGKTTSFSNKLWLPISVVLTGMRQKPIAQLLNDYTDTLWLQSIIIFSWHRLLECG